jgi:hypothetical protein
VVGVCCQDVTENLMEIRKKLKKFRYSDGVYGGKLWVSLNFLKGETFHFSFSTPSQVQNRNIYLALD